MTHTADDSVPNKDKMARANTSWKDLSAADKARFNERALEDQQSAQATFLNTCYGVYAYHYISTCISCKCFTLMNVEFLLNIDVDKNV